MRWVCRISSVLATPHASGNHTPSRRRCARLTGQGSRLFAIPVELYRSTRAPWQVRRGQLGDCRQASPRADAKHNHLLASRSMKVWPPARAERQKAEARASVLWQKSSVLFGCIWSDSRSGRSDAARQAACSACKILSIEGSRNMYDAGFNMHDAAVLPVCAVLPGREPWRSHHAAAESAAWEI